MFQTPLMIAQTVPFRALTSMACYPSSFSSFFFVFLFFHIRRGISRPPLPDLNESLYIGAEPGHCALSFRFLSLF